MSTSREPEAKPARPFDIRTVDRNIKKGYFSRKDYDKHLKALPDVAEKVAPAEEAPGEETETADEQGEA